MTTILTDSWIVSAPILSPRPVPSLVAYLFGDTEFITDRSRTATKADRNAASEALITAFPSLTLLASPRRYRSRVPRPTATRRRQPTPKDWRGRCSRRWQWRARQGLPGQTTLGRAIRGLSSALSAALLGSP
jgi:hypothetical protein